MKTETLKEQLPKLSKNEINYIVGDCLDRVIYSTQKEYIDYQMGLILICLLELKERDLL